MAGNAVNNTFVYMAISARTNNNAYSHEIFTDAKAIGNMVLAIGDTRVICGLRMKTETVV